MKGNPLLTRREKEIMAMASKGLTRKEIASKLFISTETVKKHFQNAYKKLKVKNKMQAVNRLK
jgi:DNA-binding CsgD family transcriptional regulator